ncbi:polyisoprenoid-binding protein [Arenibacter sp. H213]|uniref:YceI family protein n=2 Tax=Arenibacter TaxID=178469 RepID=A0ABW5VFP1_9FLAO|nr:polyisoprenoid-binding protein [Arenibacter sp. H213]
MCSTAITAQSNWKADLAHSRIRFNIAHLMISEVSGHFSEFDVQAVANEEFSEPEFVVEIKPRSIDTNNEKRDAHLRSDDFFHVEIYPSITFKSISFEKTGKKTFKLRGDLTMHGTTKSVILEGRLNGIITDAKSEKLTARLKLTGTLVRRDFGIGSKSFTIGDEVDISINLEMEQQ